MSDERLRIKLKLNIQKKLFKKFHEKLGSFVKCAKYLGIPTKGSYANYHYCKTRFVPISILNKIISLLKINSKMLNENIEDKLTLPEIRRKYGITKAFRKLRKMYGDDWHNLIMESARKKLKLLYGNNPSKQLWKLSAKTLTKKYGKIYLHVLSRRGVKVLKRKYGKEWNKIILSKAYNKLREKYGNNWAKKLSKLGSISLEKKYGKNYHKELYKLAKLKNPLTNLEKKFYSYLNKSKIPFEYHEKINGVEFDFLIPDKINPRIIYEISNLKPTIHGLRFKISQLLDQKEKFPNSIFICVLKKSYKDKDGLHLFHPDIGKFLMEKGFVILWLDELKYSAKLIYDVINGSLNSIQLFDKKRLLEFQNKESKQVLNNMEIGAKNMRNKFTEKEKTFHELLIRSGSKPSGPFVINTKYDGFVNVDNYEELNGNKLIYEISESNDPFRMAVLAGKLAYLKTKDNIKTISILPNLPKATDSYGFRRLIKFSDAVILSSGLNEIVLQNIKKELTSN